MFWRILFYMLCYLVFLSNHSSIQQLIEIYLNICIYRENHESTCSVFCDITKAFDRVWQKALLEYRGTCEVNFFWLKKKPAGVPQGSVLGPLPFSFYINAITEKRVLKYFTSICRWYLIVTFVSGYERIRTYTSTQLRFVHSQPMG
jgi:hypothetical protein